MQTADFMDQKRFRQIVIDACNEMLPGVKGYLWEEIIKDRLKSIEIETAPEESGKNNPIEESIKMFFVKHPLVENDETGIDRKQFVVKDRTYFFKLEDLKNHLLRNPNLNKLEVQNQGVLHFILKSIGAKSTEKKSFNKKQHRVWTLPIYPEHITEVIQTDKEIPKWSQFEEEQGF